MKNKKLTRVDQQVSILFIVILILFSISLYAISTHIYYDSILVSLTQRVGNIHNYVEHALTAETFFEINTNQDMSKESYQSLKTILENTRNVCNLRYLYTAKQNSSGELIYIVDGLSQNANDFRYPGDQIESEIQDELSEALKGKTVLPNKILNTDWGNIFIAYFPLHDDSGNVIGALGLEMAADTEIAAIGKMKQSIFFACLFFCGISITASLKIFRRISNPLYRDMLNTDLMTKLKNRNAYETDCNNLITRNSLENLTVVVIDLNNLKLVNDQLGHDIGDQCLIIAANILGNLENSKTSAYRYGGDEFILLMKDEPNPMPLLLKAKEEFNKHYYNLEIPVALAIGYAKFDKRFDKSIIDTQKRADKMMYHDKTIIKESINK